MQGSGKKKGGGFCTQREETAYLCRCVMCLFFGETKGHLHVVANTMQHIQNVTVSAAFWVACWSGIPRRNVKHNIRQQK